MKKKVEADYLYHLYELEKTKQQKQKQNTISKENFKNSVSAILILLRVFFQHFSFYYF